MFFSSSLDRAADRHVRAQLKAREAKRQQRGVAEALTELRRAEAHWNAVCSGAPHEAQSSLIGRIFSLEAFRAALWMIKS